LTVRILRTGHQTADACHALRALGEYDIGPRNGTAETDDELAPLHVRSHAQEKALYRLKRVL
jgi:hypothetical protein